MTSSYATLMPVAAVKSFQRLVARVDVEAVASREAARLPSAPSRTLRRGLGLRMLLTCDPSTRR